MGVKVNGQAGERLISDGAETEVRLDRTGAVVTTDAHGRYQEACSRGRVYTASTAVAGVAPGTALSTTPPFSIWNPANSGVLAVMLRSALGYISGTIGAGTVVYGVTPSQTSAPTGGTELVPQCLNLSAKRGNVRVFQGSTLVAAPAIVMPAFQLQPTLATAPAAGGFVPAAPAIDELAGLIIIPPACVLALQGVAAAGTSPLVLISGAWEELVIPGAQS